MQNDNKEVEITVDEKKKKSINVMWLEDKGGEKKIKVSFEEETFVYPFTSQTGLSRGKDSFKLYIRTQEKDNKLISTEKNSLSEQIELITIPLIYQGLETAKRNHEISEDDFKIMANFKLVVNVFKDFTLFPDAIRTNFYEIHEDGQVEEIVPDVLSTKSSGVWMAILGCQSVTIKDTQKPYEKAQAKPYIYVKSIYYTKDVDLEKSNQEIVNKKRKLEHDLAVTLLKKKRVGPMDAYAVKSTCTNNKGYIQSYEMFLSQRLNNSQATMKRYNEYISRKEERINREDVVCVLLFCAIVYVTSFLLKSNV